MRHLARFDTDESRIIAHCIHELELGTRAEAVLVLRRFSGNYRDVDYLFGALASFALLCLILFSPWEFPELSIPLPMAFAFGLAAWVCRHHLGLRRGLTRERRRREQALKAAHACFFERGLHRKANACGILLYYSALEGRAEIVADTGAEETLPPERLESFRARLEAACAEPAGRAERIGEFLRTLGVHLGRELPPDGSGGEIEDAPELDAEDER